MGLFRPVIDALGFVTTNAERMRITSDGNVQVINGLMWSAAGSDPPTGFTGPGCYSISNVLTYVGGSTASRWLNNALSASLMRRNNSSGVLKIAGAAERATTEGTNHLDIFDGTAPVGTLAAGISLYSTTGELRVMDSGGTATLLSASDKGILAASNPSWMPWAFPKENPYTGERWEVDMGRLIAWAEAQSGQKFATKIAVT